MSKEKKDDLVSYAEVKQKLRMFAVMSGLYENAELFVKAVSNPDSLTQLEKFALGDLFLEASKKPVVFNGDFYLTMDLFGKSERKFVKITGSSDGFQFEGIFALENVAELFDKYQKNGVVKQKFGGMYELVKEPPQVVREGARVFNRAPFRLVSITGDFINVPVDFDFDF